MNLTSFQVVHCVLRYGGAHLWLQVNFDSNIHQKVKCLIFPSQGLLRFYIAHRILLLQTISQYFLLFPLNEKHQKKVVKKEKNSAKVQNQSEIEFYFYNRYYFVVKINKQRKVIRYYKLYRINSDNKNFYLYLDKTHALIVSKAGFVKGTPKEFKNFISKKCKFKYSE